MRYFLSIAVIFGMSMVLVGCTKNTPEEPETGAVEELETPEQQMEEDAKSENEQNMIEGMAMEWGKAIADGKSLKCTYRTEDGMEGSLEADGQQYKTRFETPQGNMVSVFDGEKFYTWQENGAMAYSMTQGCLESFSQNAPSGTDMSYEYYESSEEAIGSMPDISCEEVSGVDVSVPNDIDFVDQCSVMEEQMEALEQLQQQFPDVPEGVEMMP